MLHSPLPQFAGFKGPEAIRDAVLAGSEQLGLEHLSLLLQIAPTQDEAKALRLYRGPFAELSPPEQFLLVMSAVPRLVSKVRLWRWKAPLRLQVHGVASPRPGSCRACRSCWTKVACCIHAALLLRSSVFSALHSPIIQFMHSCMITAQFRVALA